VSSGLVDRGDDCVGGAGVGYGGSVARYALGASVVASSTTGASRLQTATVLPADSASGSASAMDGVAGLVVAFSIQLVLRRVSFWSRARSLVRLWASIGLGVGLGSGVSIGVFGSGVGLLARRSLRRCLRRCFQLQARLSDPSLGDSAPSLGHSASILALERPACFRASERYLPLVYSLFRYSGAAMSS
jgi:hypothetical protein